MSDTLGKWSIRFYKPNTALPCETHDGGDKFQSAGELALALTRQRKVDRSGLTCIIVNTRPTRREKADYDAGKGALRWRLDKTKNPVEFIGIEPTGIPILA